ncbi:MAG: hypothetical protein IJX08_05280 [Clostridia bacterium]|nr:hypothetical protein [Clostridia bacterium]
MLFCTSCTFEEAWLSDKINWVRYSLADLEMGMYPLPQCNADPQMRGIHALRVIRTEEEAQYFPYWSVMETQGIFVPQDET